MNLFDTIYQVERNGKVFFLHWKNRFDPVTLAIAGVAAGTGLQVAGTLQQGRQAEDIAKQRAAVDVQNAQAVREASVEEARIKKERGRRVLATQKSQAAAGGIRINVGVPLVIEAETEAEIARDIGLGLERGRAEEGAFLSSAAIERASGKAAKRRSRFLALTQGLLGASSIAFKAKDAGLFKKTPRVGAKTFTGSSAGFGAPTHTGGRFA